MQFGQFLSTVNSPHCHTNGQSSVQHGRQRWTVHGEHVRQLTHVVFDRKDWKKGRVRTCAGPRRRSESGGFGFFGFFFFVVNNFGDEHVRRAQIIGANLSWVLKNSLEFLKNFWWRNHSKIRSSSRVKLKRNIRSYLRSSLLFFEFKYLIPEIKLFW